VVGWGAGAPPASVDGRAGSASAIAAGSFHSLAVAGLLPAAVPALGPLGRVLALLLVFGAGAAGLARRSRTRSRPIG
jgi:hypothetical protein